LTDAQFDQLFAQVEKEQQRRVARNKKRAAAAEAAAVKKAAEVEKADVATTALTTTHGAAAVAAAVAAPGSKKTINNNNDIFNMALPSVAAARATHQKTTVEVDEECDSSALKPNLKHPPSNTSTNAITAAATPKATASAEPRKRKRCRVEWCHKPFLVQVKRYMYRIGHPTFFQSRRHQQKMQVLIILQTILRTKIQNLLFHLPSLKRQETYARKSFVRREWLERLCLPCDCMEKEYDHL
jgi:hypothetical protein